MRRAKIPGRGRYPFINSRIEYSVIREWNCERVVVYGWDCGQKNLAAEVIEVEWHRLISLLHI